MEAKTKILRDEFNKRRMANPLDGQDEPVVFAAMDEYAKIIACGFQDWANNSGWYIAESKDGWFWYGNGSSIRYKTEQLFNLYIDSNLLNK